MRKEKEGQRKRERRDKDDLFSQQINNGQEICICSLDVIARIDSLTP